VTYSRHWRPLFFLAGCDRIGHCIRPGPHDPVVLPRQHQRAPEAGVVRLIRGASDGPPYHGSEHGSDDNGHAAAIACGPAHYRAGRPFQNGPCGLAIKVPPKTTRGRGTIRCRRIPGSRVMLLAPTTGPAHGADPRTPTAPWPVVRQPGRLRSSQLARGGDSRNS